MKLRKVISLEIGETDDSPNMINSDFNRTSVFTNEVVIIRPKIFYENREAHQDNKFMKESGLEVDHVNTLVHYFITKSLIIGITRV